jgi:ribosomal protein S18
LTPDANEKEELLRENELNYVQGYLAADGPFKYMSDSAKEKIHMEIDERMQELEETGLTRNEILYEEQEGIKLQDDPFYQFVKNSRTAREMLLKPGDEFTADRIVELALRQDIGPDPSMSMNREDLQFRDWDDYDQPNWEYKKKYRDNTPIVSEHSYFADSDVVNRRRRHFEYDQEKPATFINRPLNRKQLRKKVMRTVTKDDIDFKNLPMMVKFLNDTGKLYNRYQTRLETKVQRKVAKTIKKMRAQFLLPTVGLIKPTDKIPLGSYMEDIEEMHKKTIDPVTGRLFLKHSL